jgi:phosphate transport system ATP-binding protein
MTPDQADQDVAEQMPATADQTDGTRFPPEVTTPAIAGPEETMPAFLLPGQPGPADAMPPNDPTRGIETTELPPMLEVLVPTRTGPLSALEAREVSAWFGDHKVLERVSLIMKPGTVTALIGPSGCGKSTFLRILNRMHEMVSGASLAGQVLLDDTDIYDPAQRPTDVRRRIGLVFQKPNPFPAMSIYDNVASGLKLAGIKVPGKDDVVEASLRRAGLWNEVHRRLRAPGGSLSGGQQQRLCIARALAVQPDVLLMDEPCSALDPTSTRRIEDTIAELRSQVTIVIVTHNMQQAARVSQNCAFFLATDQAPGHIVETGPTGQLFESPSDPRTSDYVHGRFG